MPRTRLPFLFALLLFTAAGPALAQQDEADFSLGLKKIESAMNARRWKRALDLLDNLLDTHRDQSYVRAHRARIVDLHKRASFRHLVKEPDPKDLVGGDLISCNLSSGRIKIRYRRASELDFTGGKGTHLLNACLHRARFMGPYTVEIKGEKYPSMLGTSSPPCIWVCVDRGEGFIVSFGFEQVGGGGGWGGAPARWTPARIASVKKGGVVAEKLIPLARSGKPFRMKVKVGKNLVISSYNGKSMLRARKSEKVFGGWGFSGLGKFREIIISGQAEPSWLQGRFDAYMAKKRKAFDGTYRPQKQLPSWLFEAPDRTSGPPITKKKDDREYPGPEPELAERRVLKRATALLKRGRFEECRGFLRRFSRDEIALVRHEFLMASSYLGLGELERAASLFKRACRRDPSFAPAHLKLVEITYWLGRHDDAHALLKRLIEQHPRIGAFHKEHVLLLLREGRIADARAALEKARGALGPGEELYAIETLLVKATKGPDWGRVFRHRSAHYDVLSDIDQKTCAEAARILEDSLRAYSVHLKRVRKDNRRFTVYLFSGQAGFLAHCRDALGGASTRAAGVYSPVLKQLLIWNLPDRNAMMRTVRHEGFHQYLDRIMEEPPVWLNEGLAEYYETADYVNGRWQIGKVRDDHLETLVHGKALQPLEEFIRLPKHRFYRTAGPCYAQAWALIHFFRHGPAKYRPLFEKLFEALQGDDPTSTVLDRVFGEVDLDLLDTEFRLYMKRISETP